MMTSRLLYVYIFLLMFIAACGGSSTDSGTSPSDDASTTQVTDTSNPTNTGDNAADSTTVSHSTSSEEESQAQLPAIADKALVAGQSTLSIEQMIEGEIVARTVHIAAPDNIDTEKDYPIVFAFHGAGGRGSSFLLNGSLLTEVSYPNCDSGHEVRYVVAENTGHGFANAETNAQSFKEVWAFFKLH